jgi:hypothetical protein
MSARPSRTTGPSTELCQALHSRQAATYEMERACNHVGSAGSASLLLQCNAAMRGQQQPAVGRKSFKRAQELMGVSYQAGGQLPTGLPIGFP